MLKFGLHEAIQHLALVSNVCWCVHVLRRALELEVEGHGEEVRPRKWGC